jgi:O-antigen/teichoic acid export membrane protein
MINSFLSSIFFRIDVLLLQPLRGSDTVGWYTTAYKFIDGLNFIPSFFTLALFPVMSRYAEVGAPEGGMANARSGGADGPLQRSYAVALKLLLLVSIPIAAGTSLLADRIILLFFGPDFEPSILALRILIWFLPFSFVNSVTHYVLIAVNQQRFLTVAFLIGAGFNISGNLVAISLWGLAGAAVMTVVSEIVLLIPFLVGIHRHVGRFPGLGLSVRPLLAAALMAGVLYLLLPLNLFLLIPLGAVFYAVGLLALGTFGTEDWALARQLLRRSSAEGNG